MSNCGCFTEIDPQFLADLETATGKPEWHALYTVVLGSLVEDGVFDWSKPELDWSSAAYDAEQYERVCSYFIERYRYNEISMLPVKEWMLSLRRRLVYELMPKYRILYAEEAKKYGLDTGWRETGWDTNSQVSHDDDFYKGRAITSDYPETLLSQNADYASDGRDEENERVKDTTHTLNSSYEKVRETDTRERLENLELYLEAFAQLDKRLLDELEIMFIQIYTANVNGL
jgi:hypothetical protein